LAFSFDSCLRAFFVWVLENNPYRLPKNEQGLTRIKFSKAEASKLLASRNSFWVLKQMLFCWSNEARFGASRHFFLPVHLKIKF